MTDEDADCAIEDAKRAKTELHIKDNNGKVFQNTFKNPIRWEEEELSKIDENSELELLCSLNSSTVVIEQEMK